MSKHFTVPIEHVERVHGVWCGTAFGECPQCHDDVPHMVVIPEAELASGQYAVDVCVTRIIRKYRSPIVYTWTPEQIEHATILHRDGTFTLGGAK